MESKNITVSVYRNSVPPYVNAEMDQLYQHRYASFLQLKIYGQITDTTSTYEVRESGKVTVILLFDVENAKVRVLNEQISLDEDEIERFARHIFASFEFVNVISFPVIQADIRRISFPHQQCHSTQDIVLALPPTVQKYTASLGKATRSYVKRYLNKLKRDFGSVSFNIHMNEDVSEQHIRDIIEFNRSRMAGMYKSSYIDDEEASRMFALLKQRGFVGVLTIDGRTCAGTINYRFGRNYFLQVVAHGSLYDDYGLGTLSCYLTICECIARGGNEYHFLWGQYEYKYRLLGVQRDLDHLAIYRSRLHFLLNGGTALRIALAGCNYTVKSWLLHKGRRKDNSSFMFRLVFHIVNGMRAIKRSAARILQDRDKIARAVTPRKNE
jgi:hypothetical protein